MIRTGLFYLIFLILALPSRAQWCCIDTSLIIEDQSTQNLRFQINGAVRNDLADTLQGICGVRLKFEHDFIGDLTMFLVSPAGQTVQLLGDVCNSNGTKFTKWKVGFVPCAQKAIPDPGGFTPKWSNCQPWGFLSKFFNGTYYPFNGCLEDFNLGSVNGTWTLIIKDEELFNSGKLEQFCLLFCDDNGVNCNTCNANGGFFNEEALEFCQDDPALKLNISINLPNFTPDTKLYGYQYYISQNDTIVSLSSSLDMRAYPPGNYIICGISYLLQDSSKLLKVGSATKFSNFRNDLISGKAGMCAELSKNCVDIKIKASIPPTDLVIKVCSKDTFRIEGTNYLKSGKFKHVLTSVQGCDSLINLDITITDLNLKINAPDDINCSNSNVVLDASGSTVPTNVKIEWSTLDGNIVDTTDLFKIVVNKKGKYKLKVGTENCIDSIEVNVINTANVPELNVQFDTLTCVNPRIIAQGFTNIINVNWTWKDPFNNIIGDKDTVGISAPGKYVAIVTDASGCTNKFTFEVKENKIIDAVSLSSTPITCKSDSAFIKVSTLNNAYTYLWTGPNNFISNDSIALVRNSGKYDLVVTALNGCTLLTSIDVLNLRSKPDFEYKVDKITCKDSVVLILPILLDSLKLIEYTGPNNFFSNDLNPKIRLPGKYNVKIIDTAGCLLDTFVIVEQDTEKATIKLSSLTLVCLQDSVQIMLDHISNPGAQYKYEWSGPVGYSSALKEPWAKERGLYKVIVTPLNGCVSEDTILVEEDTTRPKINLYADTLTCQKRIVKVSTQVKNAKSYSWIGPNNFSSMDSILLINEPGIYSVTVTGSNSCTSERTTEVFSDTIPPIDGFSSDTITCSKPFVVLKPKISATLDSIYWSFNNSFFSFDSSPTISVSGYYKIYARGRNGCKITDSVYVPIDTFKTLFTANNDSITCVKLKAILEAQPIIPGLEYRWINPTLDTIILSKISVSESGTYQLVVVEKNGCESKLNYFVKDLTQLPKITLSSDTITCGKDTASILSQSNNFNLNYKWTLPGGQTINDKSFKTTLPGWHYVTVTNEYGCQYRDSIQVISKVTPPRILFSDSIFNCLNKSNIFIEFTNLDSLVNFFWTDPNNNIINTKRINNPISGIYKLEAKDSFDCKYQNIVKVVIDTIPPIVTSLSVDTFNCEMKQVRSNIILQDTALRYQWLGPNQFTSGLLNPVFPNPGKYNLHIDGKNFCPLDTSIEIIIDTTKPLYTISGDSINCSNPNATIKINSLDKNLIINWVSSSGQISVGNPLVTSSGGLYSVEIILPRNRCKSNFMYDVVLDTLHPIIQVNNFTMFCLQDSLRLEANSTCSDGRYIWTKLNGQFIEGLNPSIRDTGKYSLTVICKNFCSDSTEFIVNRRDSFPAISIINDSLSCKKDSIQLRVLSVNVDSIYIWTGPNNFKSNQMNPTVTFPGVYALKVFNKFGCSTDTLIDVKLDSVSPIFKLEQLDSFKCNNINVVLAPTNLDTLFKSFIWTTNNGNIVSQNNSTATITKPGDYTLTVRDSINGCQFTQNIKVDGFINSIKGAVILVKDITCDNRNDGEIQVLTVNGGEAAYSFALDNSNYGLTASFNNLGPNVYHVFIKDKYSCVFDTLITIENKQAYSLEIIRDTVIHAGDAVPLRIVTNLNNIFSSIWSPINDLSCSNCINPIASPKSSTEYHLVIADSLGCEVSDDVTIEVVTDLDIFIPTVFSPNGDNINDFFDFKTGAGIKLIKSFEVFDRWGERVYQLNNFDPNHSQFGWDGKFQNQLLNPGVFVYRIIGTTLFGEDIVKFGDITLIR